MAKRAADVLLAVGHELRLQRFMGPLPFDVAEWTLQARECDLPRLERSETGYHFEVGTVDHTVGTFFDLQTDSLGKPYLMLGGPARRRVYPADPRGWRVMVAELNRFAAHSAFAPQTYIWLRGHKLLARQADTKHRTWLEEVARSTGNPWR